MSNETRVQFIEDYSMNLKERAKRVAQKKGMSLNWFINVVLDRAVVKYEAEQARKAKR